MNLGPHLAPSERRIAAFVIDLLLLGAAAIVFGAVMDEMGASGDAIALVACGAFVAYHAMGLADPSLGIGRVVVAISVVSLRGGPELSRLQCIARPVVRVLWTASGMLLAAVFSEPRLIPVPTIIDVALMAYHPARQTVADLVCRTAVVMLPPMQPHRAPAGPMFSADDAEFGSKPRR